VGIFAGCRGVMLAPREWIRGEPSPPQEFPAKRGMILRLPWSEVDYQGRADAQVRRYR